MTYVDVLHDDTLITLTAGGDVLNNFVTPGEFISIAGQEFRVCLNQDETFVNTYGELSATVIPLCNVSNAWVQAKIDTGFASNVLVNILSTVWTLQLELLTIYLGYTSNTVTDSFSLAVGILSLLGIQLKVKCSEFFEYCSTYH